MGLSGLLWLFMRGYWAYQLDLLSQPIIQAGYGEHPSSIIGNLNARKMPPEAFAGELKASPLTPKDPKHHERGADPRLH